jgi:uncharacterized membrane protein YccC
MDKTTRFKEAFKVALAFALVYGIALKLNWMVPSWAGWGVVAIATSSVGQSLQKGTFRMLGTLLACFSGIVIIALYSHNRWAFAFSVSVVIFFYAYIMLINKSRAYFWFVAAYVYLVITAVGPSPVGAFTISVYRTLETAMGIGVFTLIAVFLWPRTNIGDIKKASIAIMNTQISFMRSAYELMAGNGQNESLKDLRLQEVKQLDQFSRSLQSEGSESYQVKEVRHLWDQLEQCFFSLHKTKDRLFTGIEELSGIDISKLVTDLDVFINGINDRFAETASVLSGNNPVLKLQTLKAIVNSDAVTGISHLEKSALAIVIDELNTLEKYSRAILMLTTDIAGFRVEAAESIMKELKQRNKSGFNFHIFDIENLKGALYVASVVLIGFVIWFYFNPPGHSGWYIVGGVFALIFVAVPQFKVTKLIGPLLVIMFIFSLVYVFVLPELTRYYELGILLFICMFLVRYFFSGGASAIFSLVLMQLLSITNPQSYNVSGLINSFAYMAILLLYLYGMSLIISSPMPEKAFIKLMRRFSKSAGYLISQQAVESEKPLSFIENYKTAFYVHELKTLPGKITAWGKAIDKKLFPNTSNQQIEEMISALQLLAFKIEALMDAKSIGRENDLPEMLREAIDDWKQKLGKTLDNWETNHDELNIRNNEAMKYRINLLEEKLAAIVSQNKNSLNEKEGIQFYHLLGSFHGVTQATLSFANAADNIDWHQYKEERFQ